MPFQIRTSFKATPHLVQSRLETVGVLDGIEALSRGRRLDADVGLVGKDGACNDGAVVWGDDG